MTPPSTTAVGTRRPLGSGFLMRGRVRVVASNAAANLVRGASGTLLNLVLPMALIRVFPVAEYAVWVLVFSVSLYAVYLDLGLVSSLSTLVASAEASGDLRMARRYVGVGFRMIGVAALAIVAGYLAVAVSLHALFPEIPDRLVSAARSSILLLAIAQIMVLLSNVITGYFVGLQRSRVPATVIAIGKIAVFAATFATALLSAQLSPTATAYLAATSAYFLVLLIVYRREPRRVGRPRPARPPAVRTVLAVSGVLGTFSIAMLLISGLDAAVVARFAYRDLARFGVAASVGTLVVGLAGALLSPLLPEFTRMATAEGSAAVRRAVCSTTSLVSHAMYGLFVVAILGSPAVLPLLAGAHLGAAAYPLVVLYVLAAVVRCAVMPLSAGIVALEQRRRILLVPACSEALVNLAVSITLTIAVGAAGVALGTIAGAYVGAGAMLAYVVPRSDALVGARRHLVIDGLLKPLLRLTPAIISAATFEWVDGSVWLRTSIAVLGCAVSALLVFGSSRAAIAGRLRGGVPVEPVGQDT